MTISDRMALADVKNRLSEVVDGVEREHGRVLITRHGKAVAVLLSVDDLESLEETLDVMSDSRLMKDIRESLADLDGGGGVVLSKEEAIRLTSEA